MTCPKNSLWFQWGRPEELEVELAEEWEVLRICDADLRHVSHEAAHDASIAIVGWDIEGWVRPSWMTADP